MYAMLSTCMFPIISEYLTRGGYLIVTGSLQLNRQVALAQGQLYQDRRDVASP